MKKLQAVDPQCKPVIEFMNSKGLKEHNQSVIDSQGILHKTVRDHDK